MLETNTYLNKITLTSDFRLRYKRLLFSTYQVLRRVCLGILPPIIEKNSFWAHQKVTDYGKLGYKLINYYDWLILKTRKYHWFIYFKDTNGLSHFRALKNLDVKMAERRRKKRLLDQANNDQSNNILSYKRGERPTISIDDIEIRRQKQR